MADQKTITSATQNILLAEKVLAICPVPLNMEKDGGEAYKEMRNNAYAIINNSLSKILKDEEDAAQA